MGPVAVFVLVHGAWGGAHGFRKVRRPLHSAGHEVFTPSLTGIGERAHLASPQVCLTTHIADVANAVLYEDLRDIVLVGFSYGGLVITGALEHIWDRVGHLVYLDAFVPADGESLETITGSAGRAVLGRRGPGQELAGLALPGGRHYPHDPQQPPGRPGAPAVGTRLRRAGRPAAPRCHIPPPLTRSGAAARAGSERRSPRGWWRGRRR